MEHSISSLAFKGTISEAIAEAKTQKKLFVVYISGDNEDSVNLDKSMWSELNVAETISKYCILLHLTEGSENAQQFSSLYPQKTAPCITAIGYNGVQLWQNEGLISSGDLSSNLEKAWLSLHVQETTASFLTAALASRISHQVPSGSSPITSLDTGSSAASDFPASFDDNQANTVEAGASADHGTEASNQCELPVEEICPKVGDEDKVILEQPASSIGTMRESGTPGSNSSEVGSISGSSNTEENLNVAKVSVADKFEKVPVEQPALPIDTVRELGTTGSNGSGVGHMSGCSNPEENLNFAKEVPVRENVEALRTVVDEASEIVKPKSAGSSQIEKVDNLDLSASISNDVHLNIRVPDGASLQEKFLLTSTLRMVKSFVDEKIEGNIGPYDLAIPYPRKVFNDQDLAKTLSELGLLNRQALILVPHQRGAAHHKGRSFLPNQTTSDNTMASSNGSSEGYFSFVKRMISYVNPFSYLRGAATSSSTTAQESQSSSGQHGTGTGTTRQGNFTGSRGSYHVSPNQGAPSSGGNNTKTTRPSSSRFGANIHTLKHDEDDSNFSGRNSFWNGNSTQYGGDNSEDK